MIREEFDKLVSENMHAFDKSHIANMYITSLETHIAELTQQNEDYTDFRHEIQRIHNEQVIGLEQRIAFLKKEVRLWMNNATSSDSAELEAPKTCEGCKYENITNMSNNYMEYCGILWNMCKRL